MQVPVYVVKECPYEEGIEEGKALSAEALREQLLQAKQELLVAALPERAARGCRPLLRLLWSDPGGCCGTSRIRQNHHPCQPRH